MSSGGDSQLFEDTFTVTEYDQSKYDRVARIKMQSTDTYTNVTLDVHIELFPVHLNDMLNVVLTTSLAHDGGNSTNGPKIEDDGDGIAVNGTSGGEKREGDAGGWRNVKDATAVGNKADQYDYVCHGKIYRFEDGANQTLKAYISFGGLLMMIDGPYKKLTPLRVENTYLLVKK